MTRAERIVFTFFTGGISGKPAVLTQGGEFFAPSGDDFVGVSLMPHIPDNLVMGEIKNPVQG